MAELSSLSDDFVSPVYIRNLRHFLFFHDTKFETEERYRVFKFILHLLNWLNQNFLLQITAFVIWCPELIMLVHICVHCSSSKIRLVQTVCLRAPFWLSGMFAWIFYFWNNHLVNRNFTPNKKRKRKKKKNSVEVSVAPVTKL